MKKQAHGKIPVQGLGRGTSEGAREAAAAGVGRLMAALLLAMVCAAPSTQGALVINEVCYDNSTVADETGNKSSDWIELYNSGPGGVNVNGYGLGDANPYEEAKGVLLPNYTIPPGGYLVVFVSSDLPEYTVWTNAPNIALIPSNSVWRYYAASAAPAATWKTNTFDDASWAAGQSPLGYNDPKQNLDCARVLEFGGNPASRWTAAYFRKTFPVPNPSAVTGLVMNARINDGMVVYLNGREVYRYNMPGGVVGYSTLASMSLPSTLWTSAVLATNGLFQGTNVVAVEVHQASASSPDLIMDMSLTALVNAQVPIVHGQFGLAKEGENVHLFSNNVSRTRIQKFEPATGSIVPGENQTYGAYPDGSKTAFKVYSSPTPGAPNREGPSVMLTAETPNFSVAPGVYGTARNVTLSTATSGLKILFSTDGSDPIDSSRFVYSGNFITVSNLPPAAAGLAWTRTNPVEISNGVPAAAWMPPIGGVAQAMVLRAVAVSSDGKYRSPERRGTYFIGPSFTNRPLPLVSLIANTNDLFSFTSGLLVPGKMYADSPAGYGDNKWGKPYANYHQDSVDLNWERPVHFELFETALTTASVSQMLGAAMYGGGSRAIPQKTLYLLARDDEYGSATVEYALFPDQPPTSYKRFLLRNSGNDWYGPDTGVATMLKDAVFHELVKSLDFSVMAYRPTVAYINGQYWGIHNLRESYDKHYLATRYGIAADNADILMHEEDPLDDKKVLIVRIDGDKNADEEYEAMLDWIQENSLALPANYQQVQQWIDVTNHMDYIIAETFLCNTDWPINNCDFWRAHTNQTATCGKYGDTRWRWMLYDLDVAGEKGSGYDMLAYLSGGSMTGKREPAFLINQLWQNSDFRNAFVTRYANLLNTTFTPERMAAIIVQKADAIAPEIETHFRRWGRAFSQAEWRLSVSNALVQFTAARQAVSWGHLDNRFALGGTGQLTLRNARADGTGGRFIVNGMEIDATTDGVTNRAAWTGTYFRSLPVHVRAVADPGYVFDGWVGTTLTNAERNLFVGDAPLLAVARYRLAADPPYAPAGYEAWQLDNYSEQDILSGVAAEPGAPSGCANMSNFELYVFGMNKGDGLTDEQRAARASLSIHNRSGALWVGYTRLNASHTDVGYALKVTPSLAAPAVWSNAVVGIDLEARALTNVLDASTWYYEVKLPDIAPERAARFFKLEATRQ